VGVPQDVRELLIIDDDLDILEIVAEALRDEGYQVAAFPDGARALTYARDHTPALVLSDLLIPPMGGRQLVTQLRALYGQRVPIVLMSAMADQARLEGVDGVLRKPFELDDLASLVRRWAAPAN
jgi:CheY-like chemotaxis protein